MHLFHHVDVIQAVQTVPAPSHIFKAAGHVLLPVEVIGLVAKAVEGTVGIVHHLGHIPGGGQVFPLLKEVGALFQGQGMHGDVSGIQRGYRIQRAAEAVIAVSRQAGNEIHVDGLETGILRFFVGPEHIPGGVGSAAGPKYMVFHGLGVDAHAVSPVAADGAQLFGIQGIRTAAFHGKFHAPGQIKGILHRVQKICHLGGGKGGGRAAAYVDCTHLAAGFFQKLPGMAHFLHQCLQVWLQQLCALAYRAADEAAVAAPGRAEGDANIQGKIGLLQQGCGLYGGFAAVHSQLPALRGHIVHILQKLLGRSGSAAFQHVLGGDLGGADAG